tara:strand:- start:176 stop:493 length:318 start_codon:yes stop_codon:yes gene_type:complete
MARIKLGEICHCRAGDKGDISNLGLIVYNQKDYPLVRDRVTAEVVKEYFKAMVKGEVLRYELPQLGALNFVLHGALDGGSSVTTRMDMLAKSFSGILLDLEIDVP